jgi:UrcA family protein
MTMNRMIDISRLRITIAAGLLGALACGLTAMPALADSGDAPQVTVKYGDLNVSSPQGAAVLYARIRNAAKSVCPTIDDRRLAEMANRDACIDKAISGAVIKVNNAALSALYIEKTGKELPIRLASISK